MLKDTLRVIGQMYQEGVISDYAIGGAVGATFYLEPISTVDVDVFVILPTVSNTQILSLSSIYDYLLARGSQMKAEYIVVEDWPVQFLPATTKLEMEALNAAIDTHVEQVKTRVMSAEHLAVICLQTGRLKDYDRIVQFWDHKVLNEKKLEDVLARHGLKQKWIAFKRKYLSD